MKRVLFVIPSLEQGGGQKFVMDLAKGVDKREFQIKVLVYYKKTGSVFDKFAEENGIDTIYLDKKIGLDFSLFGKVRKVVKKFKPDVIHTHLNSMLYLFTSYNKHQIKLHTIHTLAEKEIGGLQSIVKFLAHNLFGVVPVAICETVAESINKTHGIAKNKIPVVYNGVECERYNLPKTAKSSINLISVGSVYSVKNFSFLVDCFSEICKERNDVRLTIVGDGVLRTDLETQISELNLADKVRITGVVSDVENYLADADIYVASSKFEGLPISMLEAMSAGLPVISTNVGGVHEIIEDGENGILVASGDKEQYIKALKQLIYNEDMRIAFAKRSKELSKKYDEKNTVVGYENLYRGKQTN